MPGNTVVGPPSASVKHVWRKMQGMLVKFALSNGKREERQIINSFAKVPEGWSAYENTFTLDLNKRAGVARIPDMGYLARTSNVDTVEATINAYHQNARFAYGDMAHFADRGDENQIANELGFRVEQKVDAMVEDESDYFYGFSSAILCTTDTDIAAGTAFAITVTAGYGVAGITNTRFITNLLHVGDSIALLNSSNALIDANAFGVITAIDPNSGVVTGTFYAAVSAYTTNGIRVVKANNLEQTTADGGTDLNKGMVGLLEMTTSTSVHGVSGATYDAWNAAYTLNSAGRFTPERYWVAKDEIKNKTGGTVNTVVLSQGVFRDMKSQQRSGLRYDDSMDMDIDGDVKAKGVKFWDIKGCPPGYVFAFDKKGAANWEILPLEKDTSYSQLQPRQDQAASVGRVDKMGNLVCRSRGMFSVFSLQTEQ